jgi:hypothetical protein
MPCWENSEMLYQNDGFDKKARQNLLFLPVMTTTRQTFPPH